MFHIALCNDDETDLNSTLNILKDYDQNGALDVTIFTSAIELFNSCQIINFDVAILDIEMTSPNGYEIAQQLVKQQSHPLIIFLTKSSSYSVIGYGIAFRYVTKPVDRSLFYAVLDDTISWISASRFTFTSGSGKRIWKYSDILYFEVFKHYVTLYTKDESFTMRLPLSKVLSTLPQGFFCTPHHSYIVNCAYIKSADSSNVYLTNGIILPISRRMRSEFEKQLHLYLRRS